jgi:hypothetical protein
MEHQYAIWVLLHLTTKLEKEHKDEAKIATDFKQTFKEDVKQPHKDPKELPKEGFPCQLKEWSKANAGCAHALKNHVVLIAKHYGIGITAILLLQRALQCHWNIFHNAPQKGITALGVITKAYVNLFKADPPAAPGGAPLKPQYQPHSSKPVFGIRERLVAGYLTAADHQVFLAICKAAKLPSALATGDSARQSAGADNEFTYD